MSAGTLSAILSGLTVLYMTVYLLWTTTHSFDLHYPHPIPSELQNARDPWCVDRFVKFLLSVMRLASFSDKSSVVEAILGLHSHDPLSDPTCRCLHSSLMAELNRSGCAPSLDDVEQKDFILVALRALDVVGVHSKDFYVEMLAQFLDGDEDVRYKGMFFGRN